MDYTKPLFHVPFPPDKDGKPAFMMASCRLCDGKLFGGETRFRLTTELHAIKAHPETLNLPEGYDLAQRRKILQRAFDEYLAAQK